MIDPWSLIAYGRWLMAFRSARHLKYPPYAISDMPYAVLGEETRLGFRELVNAKQASRDDIAAIERKVKAEIAAAAEFAIASPFPQPAEAETGFFA